jgi:hypothetical protein
MSLEKYTYECFARMLDEVRLVVIEALHLIHNLQAQPSRWQSIG